MSNSRSPRASTHLRSIRLPRASRMGKRKHHKHLKRHTPASKLHTLRRPWTLLRRRTITRRIAKDRLHKHLLRCHLLAWARAHIPFSIRDLLRDLLRGDIRRIMHLGRNSKRDTWPRRKGIPMISIGDEGMKMR